MCKRMWIAALLMGLASVGRAAAEDVYIHAPLESLELTEGALPTTDEVGSRNLWRVWQQQPYAVLEGEGEAYVAYSSDFRRIARGSESRPLGNALAIRVAQPREISGRLYLPIGDDEKMVMARFRIPAEKVRDASRDGASQRTRFYELKLAHYEDSLASGVPGAAWFRHEARMAREKLGRQAAEVRQGRTPFAGRGRAGDLADTYALFSGGRAMSENLQLDRVLPVADGGEESVQLDSLEGITVREIDWKPLVADKSIEPDPLARKIPSDQHAIFFPSFNAAVAMADEMARGGAPILQLAEPRSTSARSFERYQKQLCLTITDIARLLGPAVAQSVAVTGSDPYFRTGTDVAVLFEAADPAMLENLLMAQVSVASAETKNVQRLEGEIGGLAYRGVRSADREICCYIAKSEGVVIVTNSPHQLEQFVNVMAGKLPALASLDEYTFFRDRYPRGESYETAFLFLSDATIRRWCGPRWRIATSRRTRDAAVVAELQASQLDRLVQGNVPEGPLYTDLPIAGDGELTLASDGVRCSTTGSLAFMTPICEMEIDRVTKSEADAYRQWRDRYQNNWRWAFDPIALQLGVAPEKLSADLTVMPLIWGSDYRSIISYSQGAVFPPDAGDPHDTLAHVMVAINTKSEELQRQTNIVRMMTGNAQLDALSWLSDGVSVYADADPFWNELAQVPSDELRDFMEKEGWRLPVAIRAEVSNGFKLTAFLAVVRGVIEQSAPGMLNWESLTYKDQPYVKITPTQRAIGRSEQVRNVAVYYSASGKSLVVTLSEDVLRRSLDREIAAQEGATQDDQEPAALERAWIGSNLGLQVDQKILQLIASLSRDRYQREMQRRAWGNLPILNQWKQRYPDRDPVALHEQFWQERLLCPGGGQYVWNETWQTMESTQYGCPGAAKEGPAMPPLLNTLKSGNFGLTFEEQGLRARVSLKRQ